MVKKYQISILFLFVIGFCQNLFSQRVLSEVEIDSLCMSQDPCLYWDDTSKAIFIFSFYQQIYDEFSPTVEKKVCEIRDSLKYEVADWNNSLFEKRLWHYECLSDLFYEIYLSKVHSSSLRYFMNLGDSVIIKMSFNGIPVDLIKENVCFYLLNIDSTGRIVKTSRVRSASNVFLVQKSDNNMETCAVVKYKGIYYNVGFVFGGDILTIKIREEKGKCCRSGAITVLHDRNGAKFEQSFSNRFSYSHSNNPRTKKSYIY